MYSGAKMRRLTVTPGSRSRHFALPVHWPQHDFSGRKPMSTTMEVTNAVVFERREPPAGSHCRSVAATFDTASGSILRDVDGRKYIDFLSGAGSLTYGHNDPDIRAAFIEYMMRDSITHGCASTEQQRTALLHRRRPR
jgi:4-aminobutyrate aminotransferase-like enzyme